VAGISLIANRDSVTLYRTFSYRDGGKNPRNVRKTIGKVVPGTSRIVVNDYFLQLMARQGLSPGDLRGKSLSEISRLVDFKMEIDSRDFTARRLHHDRQIEIDDPRLKRLKEPGAKGRPEPARRKAGRGARKGAGAEGGQAETGLPAGNGRSGQNLGPLGGGSESQSLQRDLPGGARQERDPRGHGPQHPDHQSRDPLERRLLGFVKERLGKKIGVHGYESRPLIVKSVGAQLVLEKAAEGSGLKKVLAETFPDIWPDILTMAFHLVAGGALGDCRSRLSRVGGLLGAESLSGDHFEEIIASMDEARRQKFHDGWARSLNEERRAACDIPSVSSAVSTKGSVFFDRALKGREGESLNLAVLWGSLSNLPLRLSAYPGRASKAASFLEAVSRIPGPNPRMVLGHRFYDDDNLKALLSSGRPEGFLVRLPVDSALAKRFIDQFAGNTHLLNFNLNNDKMLFAHSVDLKLGCERPLKIHVFLDESATLAAEKSIYQNLFRLKRDLESEPGRLQDLGRFQELFRLDHEDPRGPLMVKHREAAARYRDCGWLLTLTDLDLEPAAILEAFDAKERLKACFQAVKAGLDLTGTRPEDHPLNERKAFLGLIALILMAHSSNILKRHNLGKAMAVPAIFRDLDDIVAVVDGRKVLYSRLTESQRLILEAFGAGEGQEGLPDGPGAGEGPGREGFGGEAAGAPESPSGEEAGPRWRQ
jgi:hypothetical protein